MFIAGIFSQYSSGLSFHHYECLAYFCYTYTNKIRITFRLHNYLLSCRVCSTYEFISKLGNCLAFAREVRVLALLCLSLCNEGASTASIIISQNN